MEPQIIRLKKATSCPAKLPNVVLRKKRTPFPIHLNEEELNYIFNVLHDEQYLHGSLKRNARGRTRCARCCRNHRFARNPRTARFTRRGRRAGRRKCTRMNRRR